MKRRYYTFLSQRNRDVYLAKLIAKGYRVRAVDPPDDLDEAVVTYTVADIDKWKGK